MSEQKTVREIAKQEFDLLTNHIGDSGVAWHYWKRAFDAAARRFKYTTEPATKPLLDSTLNKVINNVDVLDTYHSLAEQACGTGIHHSEESEIIEVLKQNLRDLRDKQLGIK